MTDSSQPQTLGSKIDEMFSLREEKKQLNEQIKKLDERYNALAEEVLADLDAQETTMSRGKAASAIVTEDVVAQVEDWDAFLEYCKEEDAMHLLQRRVMNSAWRETVELEGENPPGTRPFTKRSISVRKV